MLKYETDAQRERYILFFKSRYSWSTGWISYRKSGKIKKKIIYLPQITKVDVYKV